ncbi:hypothetical protein [Pseudoalteromonas luteoviolacea]|uniref:hypothetical protein n=1 Tax=Pseudoalteromonas luteoviolacea TaxID=43657 RepID=UPI001154E399|nr:hypothetical protein [Pseudoalteromonas luteoviolacea]TQF69540.1 hypothetical protein FLM44_00030 [Pseudoalteromonas luteoviolacea]
MQEQDEYWALESFICAGEQINLGETVKLTPRQAANWLAAGTLSKTKPPTKKPQKATQNKEAVE